MKNEENKVQNPSKRKNPFTSTYEWLYGPRTATHYLTTEEAYFHRPRTWVVNIIWVIVLLAVVIYMNYNLDIVSYFGHVVQWADVGDYFSRLFNINWQLFFGYGAYSLKEGVVYQLYETFSIAFLATFLGAILAIPFGLLASHTLFGKWGSISEAILIVIRTIPELLLALFMVTFTGVNMVTGVLALGLHSIGMIGKLYCDQIEGTSQEPIEALDACGARKWQAIHLGVMPNVAPNFLSVALYRFDINVRSATIIGAVMGGDCGIGFSIMVDTGHPERLGAEILGVIILVIFTGAVSGLARKKLV
jgi:phosphonate transport system permease protein